MTITQFIIDNTEKQLSMHFSSHSEPAQLSFEYLRVFSPEMQVTKKQKTIVTHKKLVVLTAIENVGKRSRNCRSGRGRVSG